MTEQQPEMAKAWIVWSRWFLLAALAFAGLLLAFVAVLDPFGMRVHAGQAAQPIMDINQRYMYPQLVRSGAFDAAVVGTSTMRLIDPQALSRDLGARFVNLAMNAATPWEQMQAARLFRQHTAAPRWLIWGLDANWCEADATDPSKWRTPRPVPAWFSREVRWFDWLKLMNLTNLEIAGRLLAYRFGLATERLRGDGYGVFTPPDESYDLARARSHIYQNNGGRPLDLAPLPRMPVPISESIGWRFPALDWLEETISAYPKSTRLMLVLPPSHVAAFPRENSAEGQRYTACKTAIAGLARRHGATVVDYAHISPVTTQDMNYWDALHFRLPIAQRVEEELAGLAKGGQPLPDGAARVSR
jgi:hypothetical protein